MDAIGQGIESIPIERQDFIDGLHGNSSSFAIESEEGDILIDCEMTLVNPNYQRMKIDWTFDNFKGPHSEYRVNGTIGLRINGKLYLSSYAGKAVFDLNLKGGAVRSLYFIYKEDNISAKITEFKANGLQRRDC